MDDRAFPLDWDEWERRFTTWADAFGLKRSRLRIRNFMADEIMGTYELRGRVVELAAVTFPNLTERDDRGRLIEKRDRFVGITWRGELASGTNGGLVSSFDELEAALSTPVEL